MNEILGRADIPERHTYFQIEKFIIGKEVTAQAQLWQIIRELKARRETVESFAQQLEDAGDNLELLDIQIERQQKVLEEQKQLGNDFDQLNTREIEINIRKIVREKDRLNESVKKVQSKIVFALEESRFLISAFNRIEQIEQLKSLDDKDAQIEYWNEKLLEEFNLRILLRNPLDSELIRTIMALNDEAPVKKHVSSMLQQVQKSMLEKSQAVLDRPEIKVEAKIKGGSK
jgi:hypothetical protein